MEPLAVALHAVNLVKVQPGERALVVQALKRAGAGEVVAVDVDRKRLDLALELGATGAFLPEEDCGVDFDVAMEVVGAAPKLEKAVKAVRKGGRLAWWGMWLPRFRWRCSGLC